MIGAVGSHSSHTERERDNCQESSLYHAEGPWSVCLLIVLIACRWQGADGSVSMTRERTPISSRAWKVSVKPLLATESRSARANK